MTKTAFVTGGSGFIGSNLARRLLSGGFEVKLLIRPGSKNIWRIKGIEKEMEIVEADLLDESALGHKLSKIKPNVVFHLAAYGAYPDQTDFQKMMDVNLIGTANLLTTAENIGFDRFIALGSSSEYGKKPSAMREEDVLEPNTPYGLSKAAATLYCQYRARENRLPLSVLRPFSVYGPWEEPGRLFPNVAIRALRNEKIEMASPTVVRDFVYVDDMVSALVKAMNSDKINQEIVNICSGEQANLKQVVDEVLKATGSGSEVQWGAHSGRAFDTDIWVGDPTKARDLLGFSTETDLSKGVEQMTEWMSDNLSYYDR